MAMAGTVGRRGFRHVMADIVAVLACVLLPFALVSVWVATSVTSTDHYVGLVRPLASDPTVKATIAREVGRRAGGGPVARELLTRTVTAALATPQFASLWVTAHREAHREILGVLQDDSRVPLDDDGRLRLDLGTLLTGALGSVGTTVQLPTIAELTVSIPVVDADQLARARTGYQVLDTARLWLPPLALLALLLAVAVSPDRRRSSALLGLGSLVMLALLAVALAVGRHQLLSEAPATYHDLIEVLWARLSAGLRTATRVTAVVALVVALVAGALQRGRPAGRLIGLAAGVALTLTVWLLV